jgi:hypothetical protein
MEVAVTRGGHPSKWEVMGAHPLRRRPGALLTVVVHLANAVLVRVRLLRNVDKIAIVMVMVRRGVSGRNCSEGCEGERGDEAGRADCARHFCSPKHLARAVEIERVRARITLSIAAGIGLFRSLGRAPLNRAKRSSGELQWRTQLLSRCGGIRSLPSITDRSRRPLSNAARRARRTNLRA